MRTRVMLLAAAAASFGVAHFPAVATAQQVVPIGGGGHSVAPEDAELADELRAMMTEDQAVRKRCEALGFLQGVPLPEAFSKEWNDTDRRHIERLKEIVKEHGWPGTRLVGRDGGMAAFLIAQHADPESQREMLPLLEKAVDGGDAPPTLVAYLKDRVRMGQGQKQLYGTQLDKNEKGEIVAAELEDPAKVDQLRAEVGLPPLADYLRMMKVKPGAGDPPKQAGPASDPALQSELAAMYKEETAPKYRVGFAAAGRWGEDAPGVDQDTPERKRLREEMVQIKKRNAERLVEILGERGWPGYSMVGHDGARAALQIARRLEGADLERAAESMEKAAKAGEAHGWQAAWLVDHARIKAGRAQVYGTQLKAGEDGRLVPHEIEDSGNVEARRKEMGMPTMEAYLKAARGE